MNTVVSQIEEELHRAYLLVGELYVYIPRCIQDMCSKMSRVISALKTIKAEEGNGEWWSICGLGI